MTNTESRIYYNLEVKNSTDKPILCNYDTIFNTPLIKNLTDYEIGVIRLRVPTSSIPLMVKNIPFEELKVALSYNNNTVINYVRQVGAVLQPKYGYAISNSMGIGSYYWNRYSIDSNGIWDNIGHILPDISIGGTTYYKIRPLNQGNKILLLTKFYQSPYRQQLIESNLDFTHYKQVKLFNTPISTFNNQNGGLTVDAVNNLIFTATSDGYLRVLDLDYNEIFKYLLATDPTDFNYYIEDIALNGTTLRISYYDDGVLYLKAVDYNYNAISKAFALTTTFDTITSFTGSLSQSFRVVWDTDRFYVMDNRNWNTNLIRQLLTFNTSHSTTPTATFNITVGYTTVILATMTVDTSTISLTDTNETYLINKTTGALISTYANNPSAPIEDTTIMPEQDKDNSSQPIYKIWDILNQINSALEKTFDELRTISGASFPSALTDPPKVVYDSSNKLFSIIVEYITNNLLIYFNDKLNELFQFTTSSDTYINSDHFYLITVENRYDNTIAIGNTTFYKMIQEASTIYKVNQLVRIIIGTNSLPVRGDYELQSTQRIITDLYPDISTIGSNDVLFYNASALRFYQFYSDMPLNRIDIQIYYQNIHGDIYPLMINPNEMTSLKLELRKRGEPISVW